MRTSIQIIVYVAVVSIFSACAPESEAPGGSPPVNIVVEKLRMDIPSTDDSFAREVMAGEIDGTKVEHLAYPGPASETMRLPEGHVTMFLFLQGTGQLVAEALRQTLAPESIAIPSVDTEEIQIKVPAGETLHFLRFTKNLSPQDFQDLAGFSEENKNKLYYTRFVDTEPYTEAIKSPNTTSRTVLPAGIVPRVSLGTVEASGPDAVGAHEHPMLDQLFLGLADNDITVTADGASAHLGEYSILHIPIGSSHAVKVKEGKTMNYMWMDFFLNKEGQEWLKTHKPVSSEG